MAASAAEETYWRTLSSGKGKGKSKGSAKGYLGEGRGGKACDGGKGSSGGSKGGGGKGADKTQSPGEASRWWRCTVGKCVAHCGGKPCWNRPMAQHCKVCMQQRGTAAATDKADEQQKLLSLRKEVAADAATKPSHDGTVMTADRLAEMSNSVRLECLYDLAHGNPTGLSKGAQKKLKKEATPEELKKAGFADADPAASTGDTPAAAAADTAENPMDVGVPANSTPLERYGISEERLTVLGLPWAKFKSLSDAYAMPRETQPLIAEATVSKALQGEASEAIAIKQAAVAKLLTATEALRQSLGEKDEISVRSSARLKTETEELQRMIKKAQPSKNASVDECAKAVNLRLRLAKQEMEKTISERSTRLANGKKNAAERHTADLKAVDELIAELKERKTLLSEYYANAETAWSERVTMLSKHDTEVLRIFDHKIKAVGPVGGATPRTPGAGVPGDDVAVPEDDGDLGSDEEEDNASYADLLLTAEGTQPEDLPTLSIKDATAGEKKTLEEVWAFLEAIKARPVGTPTPPTTFEQMGLAHVGVAQTLVSKEIWKKFYGGERLVGPTDWVPWHLMELVRVALEKAKTELTSGPERKAAAEERLNAARLAARNDGYCPW